MPSSIVFSSDGALLGLSNHFKDEIPNGGGQFLGRAFNLEPEAVPAVSRTLRTSQQSGRI